MNHHNSCKHPPLPDATQRLIADYEARKGGWNHQEKALAEGRIWDSLPSSFRQTFKEQVPSTAPLRRVVMLHFVQGSNYELDLRDRLLQAGPLSEHFWPDVNSGELPLASAIRLVRDVRRYMRSEGVTYKEAAEHVYGAYLALPVITNPKTGVSFHKRLVGRPRREPAREAPEIEEEDDAPETEETGTVSERELWNRLRKAIGKLAASKLVSVPEGVLKEQIIIGMERDVKILFDDWSNKLKRAKRKAQDDATITRLVSRPTVVAACRALHMDPPDLGKPVDMEAARRQKKRLAALYHPDSNAGDETTRAQYEAVLAAFQELQDYMDQSFPAVNRRAPPKAQ